VVCERLFEPFALLQQLLVRLIPKIGRGNTLLDLG
jgi:hypothetical protein